MLIGTTMLLGGCNGPDPIEGQNTYTICNEYKDSIKVLFQYSVKSQDIDSTIIAPQQTHTISTLIGGISEWSPNYVFDWFVFLSANNDTLLIMDVVNDDEWTLVDSIADYGYKVSYYHWLYKFNK